MDNSSDNVLDSLNVRYEKYVSVLRSAEEEGNSSKIRRYKRIISQYEGAIKLAKAGRAVALGELPNPPGFPPLVISPATLDVTSDENEQEPSPLPSPLPPRKADSDSTLPTVLVEGDAIPGDESVAEKLTSRKEKYLVVLKAAEEENAGAKVRRYKRIIKQYEEAIAAANGGRAVDLAELPNPPGFPPLVPPSSPLPSPEPSPLPTRARQPSPSPGPSASVSTDVQPVRPAPPVPSVNRVVSRAEKQTLLLKERQQEYKEAALSAKRGGQIAEAKEFLKMYKGFDRLIQASSCGLPVDISSIPPPLKQRALPEESFYLVSNKDVTNSSDTDIFEMLKQELTDQIKSCMSRRNHFKATGDIANANRFENWALTFKKDLNKINLLQNSAQPAPKFHFEQKSFPVLQCFTDIAPEDVELTIVQAVNLPKTADTYVGYEFPYPAESPPSGYTSVVKDSSDPVYNTVVKFSIDRDSKPCQRIFKRQGIKLEVWARGGFFHRDSSLGTVIIKLAPLATEIMIHDAFDLMNGRRPAGGKLEIKVRIREPIVTKKIETITEKWLILE